MDAKSTDVQNQKDTLRVGLIGYGARGRDLLPNAILPIPQVQVTAVCDVYEDRAQAAAQKVQELRGVSPAVYLDYRELLADSQVDAVIISASWEAHTPIALAAMEAGKIVASEVGGALTLEECWELVHTYERTRTPIMFLENCCYGRNELMILNMVRQGLFGEIVHCQGGYRHDLRDEVSYGRENRHYRLNHYLHRCCENYPTHELGPIAKILNINHGNRMLTLSSVASCAKGLHTYLAREKGDSYDLTHADWKQGDVVTTTIRCAGGQTIVLTLDTTLPRYYSRGFHIQGTLGMYEEENQSIFLDGVHNEDDFNWRKQWGNLDQYREQYEHPIWKEFLNSGVTGGHGGMDGLVIGAFVRCALSGASMPIDVYDMAAWMSITALSEASIAKGGAPVEIPDFTSGRWVLPDWKAAEL